MSEYFNETFTVTGVAAGDWLILGDRYQGAKDFTLSLKPGAGATVTVEATITPDIAAIQNNNVLADDIHEITNLIGITAKTIQGVDFPIKALRLNQSVGATQSNCDILKLE